VNPWVLVLAAGVLEVVWAIALKKSDGFTRWFPTLITVAGAFASFWLLAQAMRVLPAGTSYAVWVGIGALGVAMLGVILFDEPATWMHVAGVLMIVGGIVLLKLA
jgi:quaternary ammonium compound-resistance protein SugE